MEPIAYLNGKFVPFSQVLLPPYDAGFVQGTTVGEQLRTFGGRLFELERHLDRLARSLAIVGVRPAVSLGTIAELARSIVHYNHSLQEPDNDLGLSIFVTPGVYSAFSAGVTGGPTLCLHTYPLAFQYFASRYAAGQRLVVSDVRQVPNECWPAELKCRSRMHYFLADREARQHDPAARAVLLDLDGYVLEASTANLTFFFTDEGLVSPPKEKILPGISVAVLSELAEKLGVPCNYRDIRPDEAAQANEVFLTSTSPCLLPCVSWNGQPIGTGKPGPLYERLLTEWSARVGIDIRAQAEKYDRS